jgi:hypothetical protein
LINWTLLIAGQAGLQQCCSYRWTIINVMLDESCFNPPPCLILTDAA